MSRGDVNGERFIQKLLTVPAAAVEDFERISGKRAPEWFADHDPVNKRLGSGGGTAHVLASAWRRDAAGTGESFSEWASGRRKAVVHAGGQSRRMPAYAACGKALTPVPVFRWARGQRIDQTLLDLQVPFFERLLNRAPERLKLLIASGDVLIRNPADLPQVPDADIVCVGLWSDVDTASRHGVFFTSRAEPEQLSFMRQKPSPETIQELSREYLFLLDVGVWLLSERAIDALMKRSGWNGKDAFRSRAHDELPEPCDLYTDLGLALGANPTVADPELAELTAAVLPLPAAEFYHFGRNVDLVGSSLALQNCVTDQRAILSPMVKPHPAIFVQNAQTGVTFTPKHQNIWIENACVGAGWKLTTDHVITGVPENDWSLTFPAGLCLDIVPVDDDKVCIRVYGMQDSFRGSVGDPETSFCGSSLAEWLECRSLSLSDLDLDHELDLQEAALFPVVPVDDVEGALVQWLLTGDVPDAQERYLQAERLSAETLMSRANLVRAAEQRRSFLVRSLPVLANHGDRSVFYQLDLMSTASLYAATLYPLHDYSPDPDAQPLSFIHDRMFRGRVARSRGQDQQGLAFEREAFACLSRTMLERARSERQRPVNSCLPDQIVWGRSPIRLDLAGGWTDTPPYCFLHGGSVVNLAAELNGQPPIQVFARVCERPHLVMRSIDLGVSATVETWEELQTYAEVGSGFAIAKAALALAGFHPDFGHGKARSLRAQLEAFGGGIELSLLAAVPKGSGLGTSSILSATLLGALNELCSLGWDNHEIGARTLVLEQMLTTGGGWQDQFGGILRGVKWLKTRPGFDQSPEVRWLPDHLFSDPEFRGSALLYYTGITRVAKSILAEIVRGMFLNSATHLRVLSELREHAEDVYEVLQGGDWTQLARMVGRTWELNQMLDQGANPPAVREIFDRIAPWCAGAKLLGAGGGGYMLILAHDPENAHAIRAELEARRANPGARFVDFRLSPTGLQVTRS